MEIIRGIANIKNQFTQCVLTLGNFDGIHLGHHALISQLKQRGKEQNLPTVVMIFEPQPLEFFAPDNAPSRLTSFHEKYIFLEKLGVDYILAISFNHSFATQSAEYFIENWLIEKLNAQAIVVGDDFQFGKNRLGNVTLLQKYAELGYFQVESMPTFILDNVRVSSTAVRQALAESNFQLVEYLLGRAYTIQGRVVHGNALARELGFPTANIHLNRQKPALRGVYVVKVKNLCSQQGYVGVANIGIRPTVNGKKAILEVNLFDFNQDIYGEQLEVLFIEKLRDEQKFSSLDALKAQITQDICLAKKISATLVG